MLELSTLALTVLLAQGPAAGPQRPPQGAAQTRSAQPPHGLSSAKALYASASYEEALTHLAQASPSEDMEQVETYRALCLMALGRDSEAVHSLERLLDRNPFHSLSDTEVSPRLVALYRDVRTKRLPTAARDLYTRARMKFDERSYADAADLLRDLLAGLGREDLDGQTGLADLKLLAEGFLRLTEIEIIRNGQTPPASQGASPVPAAPRPAPTSPPAPPAADSLLTVAGGLPLGGLPAPVIYSQEDRYVVAPVEVARKMPNWNPPLTVQRGVYHGLLEVVINERGGVESVRILSSIAPSYDPLLLEATKLWKFRPATLNGEPVKYRRSFEIILHPESPE
ncbi:MAG TPA: hypothetical protein VES67_15240 [Vicinamibacterales bacterium]|nr:hypothetical protein [Vicinamibacterales bacterium]